MVGPQAPQRQRKRYSATWTLVWITAALTAGTGSLIPWVAMACHQEDIEAIESPLVLSVARQLESGPRGLYGPYSGRYPLVLIHAPLYYRLAALFAWPLYRAALDPVTAGLTAGRLLSSLGFLATLAAAYRLACLGGMPARAGGWAALLVAGTPIYSGIPFEVRPDMLGIALETSGILLVLNALERVPVRAPKLNGAAVCFATAVCIKQQYLVAPLVSTLLMIEAWRRGRLGLAPIARFALIASMGASLYYGAEEWLTGGRMSQSILIAARNVSQVHPADWYVAGNLLLALIWKCVGPILLFAAAGLAMVSTRRGPPRGALPIAGTTVIGAVVILVVIQFFIVRISISALLVLGLIFVITVIIPTCLLVDRSVVGERWDANLWVYWFGEMALTLILWRLSTGGWFNYAIQAVVIVCVLTGRAMARAFDGATSWRPLLPAALAALAIPVFAFTDVKQVLSKRAVENAALARLLEQIRRPAREIFFVDLPGVNRLHGRIDLVYDPWLYPVFESAGLAEPRSVWLEQALATGAVRLVAATSGGAEIDGLTRTLAGLGYHRAGRVGPYFVWARQDGGTEPITDR